MTRDGSKRSKIRFANEQEARRWLEAEAKVRLLVPTLMKLWEVEPRFLVTKKDYMELLEVGGRLDKFEISDTVWLTEAGELVLAQVESERKAGRPPNKRTIVAAMRFLLFAPPDRVLAMEKKWQEKACMKEVRDRCVTRQVKQAHLKAVKNAENCVARAREMAAKARSAYLERHPESMVYFMVADKVVSEVMAGSKQDGLGARRLVS